MAGNQRRAWSFAAAITYAAALAEALVLLVCIAVAGRAGTATVLHRVSGAYDVAAWRWPMPGGWGVAIVVAEALTILAAIVLAAAAGVHGRRIGLVLMAGWGAYWAWAIARVAWFTHDGLDLALAGLSAAALTAQVALCIGRWKATPTGLVRG